MQSFIPFQNPIFLKNTTLLKINFNTSMEEKAFFFFENSIFRQSFQEMVCIERREMSGLLLSSGIGHA